MERVLATHNAFYYTSSHTLLSHCLTTAVCFILPHTQKDIAVFREERLKGKPKNKLNVKEARNGF